MNPNVFISQSEQGLQSLFSEDFIVHISGDQSLTLRQFYERMAYLLEIPDFGFTIDELSDALNDLGWLDEEKIILYLTNFDSFASKERDQAKVGTLLSMLDATAEDWKWVDEETNDPKEIVIVIEDSPRARRLLEQEQINFGTL